MEDFHQFPWESYALAMNKVERRGFLSLEASISNSFLYLGNSLPYESWRGVDVRRDCAHSSTLSAAKAGTGDLASVNQTPHWNRTGNPGRCVTGQPSHPILPLLPLHLLGSYVSLFTSSCTWLSAGLPCLR